MRKISHVHDDLSEQINQFNDDYQKHMHADNTERQRRLKEMKDKYGVQNTALAAGFTAGTLEQYCRVATAPTINENSVLKAERFFKEYENNKNKVK